MAAAIRTNRDHLEFQAYVQALLDSGDNQDVLKALLGLDVPQPYRVRAKVIYSPTSPIEVLRAAAKKKNIKPLSDTADSFTYSEIVGRLSPTEIDVPFFVAPFEARNSISPRVQVVISVCKSDQWKVLQRLVRSLYPKLVPILLSQAELVSSAQKLRQLSGHEVRVKAFSAKEPLDGSGDKAKKSVREWTDETLDEALRGMKERGQVLTSLEVGFFPRVGQRSHVVPKATCKIRKTGEIEVTGSLQLAYDAVAIEVARVGERKLRNFAGRGLREASYKPRPLAINFTQGIFEDLETVRGFVQLLKKYSHSMHAVEHGNPYAHVKITDLFDYSAFEVWAIPPGRIALLPGLKASEAAFERLVHHIFDDFKEGQVVEYERSERTATAST